MSWTTRSRLTNVTRPPAATVASYGIMPNGVMVTVAASGGGAGEGAGTGAGPGPGAGAGDGDDATLEGAWLAGVEPHAPTASVSATIHTPGKPFSRGVTLV